MSETIITVSGAADKHHVPERATVSLTLGFDGPEREVVLEATRRLHTDVSESLRALHDPIADAVTRWSAGQVTVWGQRPWNAEGAQLPPVYHASTSVEARFRDFSVLASWLDSVAFLDGVTVNSIEWGLTSATRESLVTEAQREAIGVASAKARVFAAALGLDSLRPVAVSDPGMLPPAPIGTVRGDLVAHRMMESSSSPGGALDLTPADVVISAAVDARFEAGA